jgi:hypothetical protein
MRKQYQYILVFLSIVIVYELYLIVSFKYVDIQKDFIINGVEQDISKVKAVIENKKDYFAYINTIAYKDKIAKSSQNKKNPGEDVIFVVTKDEVEQYKKIDVQKDMYSEKAIRTATYGMSNWQKWIYYIFKVDIRD